MRTLMPFIYIDAIARSGSIRQAAEQLTITPSALNRRLLSVEEELGCQIFERLASGVRLNTAGEILLRHIRDQLSSMEQVKSRIADLSGLRKGHVSLVTSADVTGPSLTAHIAGNILTFPQVTISVQTLSRDEIEPCLADYQADIAICIEPPSVEKMQILNEWHETIVCVVSASHPLAQKSQARLYECADFAAIKPAKENGVRYLLDKACQKLGIKIHGAVEGCDNAMTIDLLANTKNLIGFALPSCLPKNLHEMDLVTIPLNARDIGHARCMICQLKGRAMSVAAARFAEEIKVQI